MKGPKGGKGWKWGVLRSGRSLVLLCKTFARPTRPELGSCRLEGAYVSQGRQEAGGTWVPLTSFSACVLLPS